MSLSIGIIGLPNVGKSTLFNALVKSAHAQASNYPFCTIDPNVGIVEVPDDRLQKLSEVSKSKQIIPTVVEFTDVAGLVRGAHKGEGLGNQFLSHIKETDAIAMVIRFFQDKDITHISGAIDPADDIRTINLELILADLAVVEKRYEAIKKETKTNDPKAKARLEIIEKIKAGLDKEIPVRDIVTPEELEPIKEFQFLTSKPILYIANVSEDQASATPEELIKHYSLASLLPRHCEEPATKQSTDRRAALAMTPTNLIPISAKIESELAVLTDDEQAEFLKDMNLKESGLIRLIQASYKLLNLITFYTLKLTHNSQPTTDNPNSAEASRGGQVQAWPILRGTFAPDAAGKVHTDVARGFIAADVIKYEDFITHNGWQGCKEKGLIKTQGKTYQIQDGDVCLFKFNV